MRVLATILVQCSTLQLVDDCCLLRCDSFCAEWRLPGGESANRGCAWVTPFGNFIVDIGRKMAIIYGELLEALL